MQLDVTPEALAAASAQVAALTGRLLGSNAAHAVATGAILPPGSDIPSVKTAQSLVAEGVSHQATAAMGSTELAFSSEGVGESGISYLIGDGEGAAIYTASGGMIV
ncbi:PE family protein [Mycobacterium xenopi]|uniref:PE family protein n=1 Tax=Mycobacterium xenopi TaxID=1789 RepID=UPI000A152010|nr:PE family protein [Mycobacterium xenopi]ORX14147.1 PE family protein [Mycobacterium xenopi]SPX94848.1 PE family protein [Mycobacterium xenopi]